MIAVSVRRAYFTEGSRNAETPLLTASTPVIAVHPLANDRISSQNDAATGVAGNSGGATTGSGRPPDAKVLTTPMASTASSETTKR